MADADVTRFWAEHCAVEGGLILVFASEGVIGVFDRFDLAQAWADEQDCDCIFSPYLVNDPEFGNRPKSALS